MIWVDPILRDGDQLYLKVDSNVSYRIVLIA